MKQSHLYNGLKRCIIPCLTARLNEFQTIPVKPLFSAATAKNNLNLYFNL